MRKTYVLGVRLSAAELDALRLLAEREARSPASWVRFRVLQECERLGLALPATKSAAPGDREERAR